MTRTQFIIWKRLRLLVWFFKNKHWISRGGWIIWPRWWNRWTVSWWALVVLWEKAMAPHSSTVAWKIPWMEEPGRLQSMGSLRVKTQLGNFTFTFHFHALEKEMATHSSVFAWRIPGTGEPGGLPSMGSHRVGHNWSDLAAAAAAIKTNMPSNAQALYLELPFPSHI